MRFPLTIPMGWFQVAYADELEVKGVQALRYFGRDLVMFRDEEGVPHVLDAHCPHLGAHLAHGGTVKGDRIRCPFHAWEFDGGGICREVPYARHIPGKAKIRDWPVVERNGMLWVWYHPKHAPPAWELPVVEAFGDARWTPPTRFRWTVHTHNQEIGENAVDRAHFRYVHGTTRVPDAELSLDGPIRRATQRISMKTPRGEVQGRIDVEAHGMGCTITRFSGICDTILLLSHTPIDAETVDSRFSFTQPKAQASKSGVGRAIIADIVKQMNEDIPIWEHKRYEATPLLCDGDGPIGAYRRWAAQFYLHEV